MGEFERRYDKVVPPLPDTRYGFAIGHKVYHTDTLPLL